MGSGLNDDVDEIDVMKYIVMNHCACDDVILVSMDLLFSIWIWKRMWEGGDDTEEADEFLKEHSDECNQ
eukprot:1442098-Lingulodinium_polyedra.AAC.1